MAALSHFEILRPLLDGHASRDFAHRGEEGQGTVLLLDRLIGDGDGAALDQCVGQFLVRGQVEVGENDLAFPDEIVFQGHGLFHVHDHSSAIVNFLRDVDNFRADFPVCLVFKSTARSGVLFHQNGMPVLDHDLHSRWSHGDAVLLGLDLFQNSYDHIFSFDVPDG